MVQLDSGKQDRLHRAKSRNQVPLMRTRETNLCVRIRCRQLRRELTFPRISGRHFSSCNRRDRPRSVRFPLVGSDRVHRSEKIREILGIRSLKTGVNRLNYAPSIILDYTLSTDYLQFLNIPFENFISSSIEFLSRRNVYGEGKGM